ncbi:hypothetical protein SPRG_04987 [Saprolegnia parasitica CBS 223.65]|uniref:Stalled ribosome sensor GCN1-like HEAT repeats region domain-containing protein n=1 Tax=Saprolegnia parasitica (strain CBS 223.65) TaxID=695850 RepID=A0A067CHK5_SAPPC|nr:hypothetical protein SPRG_04987 [Saprolegnia parasitica CBS 223.65]KDO30184.1 hypothetical protein SPRG_04987 [Saprolegnia parasitica CBS 223.65]|eukprot:XP_012198891.1 hypothetical protein SPRG_04987 [Saprolegnia parasitica CBS 223.65]
MCAMVNDAKDLTPYLLDTIAPYPPDAAPEVRKVASKALGLFVKALGKGFSKYLAEAIQMIVSGLSHESEGVRDVAMRFFVVNAYALSNTKNLFDDNWCIRESSISLLGDLLYHDSGTQMVVMCANNDEDGADTGSAAGEKAMLEILSKPRRDAVLAALCMMRSDTSAVVRQSTLQVWKSVVSNPPKTLRSILETLVQALSGKSLGECVIPEVVLILRAGLDPMSPAGMRQGVCLELAETLVVAVEDALCDAPPESMCYRSFDELIPRLLKRITSVDDLVQERALAGHQNVKVKSREVLPYLVPRLLTTPMALSNVQAIARTASVSALFNNAVSVVTSRPDDDRVAAIQHSVRAVALRVEAADVQWLAAEICKYCEADIAETRYLACWLIAAFCQSATVSYVEQVPIFLKYVLARFNGSDVSVVEAAFLAFSSLNTTTRPDELAKRIDFICNNLSSISVTRAIARAVLVPQISFSCRRLRCPRPRPVPAGLPARTRERYAQSAPVRCGWPRRTCAAGVARVPQSVLANITGPLIRSCRGCRRHSSRRERVCACGGPAFVHLVLAPYRPAHCRAHGQGCVDEGGILEANLDALVAILTRVGAKVSASAVLAVEDVLRGHLVTNCDLLRVRASNDLALTLSLGGEKHHSLTMIEELDPSSLGGVATTLAVPVIPTLVALARDENPLVKSSSFTALGLAVKVDAALVSVDVVQAFAMGFSDTANKVVNRTALRIVKRMAKVVPKHVRLHSGTLVPPIFALIKSPTSTSSSVPRTLTEYCASAEQGKLLAEYGRHVLSKLKVNGDDSDDEGVE